MGFELEIIDYSSRFFGDVLRLRNEVLRKPLGLNLNDEDLSDEKNQYIVIATEHENVIGCVMIKILDHDMVKFRQMAVSVLHRRRGIGSLLVKYAENFCFINAYYTIELHARKTAVDFYSKLGYQLLIDEFEEVGIPHYKMVKRIEIAKA
jgi:predicted GNAT family N-acyltransferase